MTDADVRRFYDSRSWKRLRQTKLSLSPLCQACTINGGTITAAVQVHHLISIRTEQGWQERFNIKLLLSLCTSCHSMMEAEIRGQEKARGPPIPPDQVVTTTRLGRNFFFKVSFFKNTHVWMLILRGLRVSGLIN